MRPTENELMANDWPVCPYCGYVDDGAWEYDFGPGIEGDGEVTCPDCGKEYDCERCVSVWYNTYARKVD